MRAVSFTFLICLVCSFNGFAQDTIFFRSKQKLVVIVKEVSPTEVQYKKIELADGPMYIISKNEVEKIVYKNGMSDVFKLTVEEAKPVDAFVVMKSGEEDINYNKISMHDARGPYYRLVNLSDRHPDLKRRENLRMEAKEIRNLKRHQNGTRTCAIIFGGVALAGLSMYTAIASASYNGYVDPIFTMQPVLFGTLGLGFGAAAVAVNIRLKQKRTAFVNLYND